MGPALANNIGYGMIWACLKTVYNYIYINIYLDPVQLKQSFTSHHKSLNNWFCLVAAKLAVSGDLCAR